MKKLILTLSVLFTCLQPLAALDQKTAEEFMDDVGQRVIALIKDPRISVETRAEEFRKILDTKFNLRAIGKFVLGRYWKEASDEEKELFLDLFKSTTISTYASRFQDYTSEKFEVLGSRPEKDGGVTVMTQIKRPNGQLIAIEWKLFEKKGAIQVYDVVLEGISMGITQRSEYAAVIQQGGGKIKALLEALLKKTREFIRKE